MMTEDTKNGKGSVAKGICKPVDLVKKNNIVARKK
jgi:hypothetical protein